MTLHIVHPVAGSQALDVILKVWEPLWVRPDRAMEQRPMDWDLEGLVGQQAEPIRGECSVRCDGQLADPLVDLPPISIDQLN